MAVIVPALGLAYFPVPKNACSTIKEALFALNEGRPFQPFPLPDGRTGFIHDIPAYKSRLVAPEAWEATRGMRRIAVVRDPLRRLVSCYKNRVQHFRELSPDRADLAALARHGVPPEPDFDTFVEQLEGYRAASPSIRHHSDPQTAFLGRDPARFADVFRMEELPRLAGLLSSLAGREVAFQHLQRGGAEFPDPEIGPATRRRMLDYCAEDLAIWWQG